MSNKLSEILQLVWNRGYGEGRGDDESLFKNKSNYLELEEAVSQIRALLKEVVVPEEHDFEYSGRAHVWNGCRTETIKRIDNL
jgi:hypothetical protein